jgi:cytolysin-activating lysine-acyltransferase
MAGDTIGADHSASDKPKADSKLSSEQNRLTAIGHATFLMARSQLHRHLMITDMEWLLLPPIMLGQFRMWQDNGKPVGFASWAYLGEEAEERITKKGIRRLMPTDWKTGEALWLIDFIAPFGNGEKMIQELREVIHVGKRMKMLQAKSEGGTGVVEW